MTIGGEDPPLLVTIYSGGRGEGVHLLTALT